MVSPLDLRLLKYTTFASNKIKMKWTHSRYCTHPQYVPYLYSISVILFLWIVFLERIEHKSIPPCFNLYQEMLEFLIGRRISQTFAQRIKIGYIRFSSVFSSSSQMHNKQSSFDGLGLICFLTFFFLSRFRFELFLLQHCVTQQVMAQTFTITCAACTFR